MSAKPHHPLRRGTLTCLPRLLPLLPLLLALQAGADAQTITGSLSSFSHPQYALTDAHFLITGAQIDGQSVYNGSMVIICTDLAATSIDEDGLTYPISLTGSYPPISQGVTAQLDVWDRYTPRDEALASAQAMWLIDTYYVDYFTDAPVAEEDERQLTGNINRSKFGPSGGSSAPELWDHMNILIDGVNNSGITASYQPTHEWFTALDARTGYQDYIALSLDASLMHTPEPTSGSLALLSGALLLARRRRRKGATDPEICNSRAPTPGYAMPYFFSCSGASC